MKIDVHTHILPPKWPDLAKRFGYGGFVSLEHHGPGCARMLIDGQFFREIQENCWSPKKRLKECEPWGVDVQVLSTVPVMFSYWARPADTLDLSRILNDHIAGVVAEHPKRFVGLGTLPLQATDLALGELERCVKELKLAGVQIGSHVNGRNLDDPDLFSVFELAEQLGAAIFVHPWDMVGKERMTAYWMQWLVGMPTETCIAICSILFGGVLGRLPKLRIGFAHGGGSFPGTIGRISRGYESRPDLCGAKNPHDPREYLGRFYLDSLVHDAPALRYLIDLVGAEHIALGSDYPFPLGEEIPGKLIDSCEGLSPQVRDRLLCGTALEFLNLDRFRFEGS
ncbi:MAG: amidohydrolase family protein [Planctomycetota bacterium]